MDKLDSVKKYLEVYEQTHILNFYDELSQEQKVQLLSQIQNIDLEQMKSIYEKAEDVPNFSQSLIEPIDYIDKDKISRNDYIEYENIGINTIKAGKLAVVTMAGGQGTRLGYNGPKGTYDIGLDTHESIFELLCNKLKVAHNTYGISVPWYIMTSQENNSQTTNFFEQNNYFGYGKENVMFFIQGKLPTLSMDGKLILEEKWKIKEAANGHGGVFESIYKSNVIKDMKNRNIEWVYIGGVDNILAKMIDPLFLGVSIKNNVSISAKSVAKVNPDEKVGVFCKKNGRTSIIEYSEISDELRNKRNKQNELLFGQANIVNHLFSIDSLDLINSKELPYHIAYKKCDYINQSGERMIATEPNAIKPEMFMFDILHLFDNVLILQVPRKEEFAPVKNADITGVDCPKTARELYIAEQNRKELN